MSTQRKTSGEVAAEIAKLKEMKPTVRVRNAFGDSHHAAIDAQVYVLENGLSADAAWDRYGDEDADGYSDNVLHAAVSAADWRNGERDAPSTEWQELVGR